MVLHWTWVGFFVIGFFTALLRWWGGEAQIFSTLLSALFTSARQGFDIALGLAGIMTLWLGLMRVGEKAGMVELLARAAAPLMRVLFPSVPAAHPAQGAMMMNLSANLLGLDNAATPLGLSAMRELQSLNREPEGRASDAQIMFAVLNTAGLTLIPTSVIALRQSVALQQGLGAQFNAADIFLPTLITTFISLIAGLLAVGWVQRLALWRVLGIFLVLGGSLTVGGLAWVQWPAAQAQQAAANVGAVVILALVLAFIVAAAWRRINAYEAFIEGAKEGFDVAVRIVPYLVAILVAIGVFRAAGCMDALLGAIGVLVTRLGGDTAFLPALPVGLMKILSGAGARGLMVDVMQTYGVDSFAARLAAVIQGSTETTLYVLAVYFGSVGIKDTRHALACALWADVVGIVAAIGVGYAMLR